MDLRGLRVVVDSRSLSLSLSREGIGGMTLLCWTIRRADECVNGGVCSAMERKVDRDEGRINGAIGGAIVLRGDALEEESIDTLAWRFAFAAWMACYGGGQPDTFRWS